MKAWSNMRLSSRRPWLKSFISKGIAMQLVHKINSSGRWLTAGDGKREMNQRRCRGSTHSNNSVPPIIIRQPSAVSRHCRQPSLSADSSRHLAETTAIWCQRTQAQQQPGAPSCSLIQVKELSRHFISFITFLSGISLHPLEHPCVHNNSYINLMSV